MTFDAAITLCFLDPPQMILPKRSVRSLLALLLWAAMSALPAAQAGPIATRTPNILWITAEDMSAALGCYGDEFAVTPHLDRFARQSVRYTRAFATAPVCSPARSTLISGRYATSLGTHNMRSAFPIPDWMRGFPAVLRDQGWYTTNNVKTDYNTSSENRILEASWNDSSETAHWRNRTDPDQPFFSVFNLMTTHQSRTMVWPYQQFLEEIQARLSPEVIHDPARAPLPPYYPDTPIIRRTIARFYDCVTLMDRQVGDILQQLEADGLAEQTIVFFFSDHGSGLPRHKRALLDSGMQVPLIIRFPETYRHLAPAGPGEIVDRLVSFVDFGPTVLSLAGSDIPADMQGLPFLGAQDTASRRYVFGHRDRVDEVFDVARSVRGHRYLYIRNYHPHRGYNQPTAWPDLGEIRHEIYRLARKDGMTGPQWHFAAPNRPAEELYDCLQDPQNLRNLAASSDHEEILGRMRRIHQAHLLQSRDLGSLPESEAWQRFAGSTPWQAARQDELKLKSWWAAAGEVGVAEEQSFLDNLRAPDPALRYWGAIGLLARPEISAAALRALEERLQDASAAVRIECANALAARGQVETALPVLVEAVEHCDLNVVLHAARTVELLGDLARRAEPAMRRAAERAEKIRPPETPATVVASPEEDLALFVSFAARSFLNRLSGR